MNIKYRVIIKVGYHEAWFEFESDSEAIDFAKTALISGVSSEDTKRISFVKVMVVDADAKERDE